MTSINLKNTKYQKSADQFNSLSVTDAVSDSSYDKKLRYRRETARQLRMIHRLANRSCKAQNTASQRGCIVYLF